MIAYLNTQFSNWVIKSPFVHLSLITKRASLCARLVTVSETFFDSFHEQSSKYWISSIFDCKNQSNWSKLRSTWCMVTHSSLYRINLIFLLLMRLHKQRETRKMIDNVTIKTNILLPFKINCNLSFLYVSLTVKPAWDRVDF